MNLVIKGAFYYDKEADTILTPHFTGEFWIVDCYEYVRMDELKEIYNDSYIEDVLEDPIDYNGKKYYSAESSPFNIGNWELLSDLSDLMHIEENYDF